MTDASIYRTILAAGTVITASGQSGPLPLIDDEDAGTLDVAIDISAVSGTSPTVVFTVQRDNDTDSATYPPAAWTAGTASAALNATGRTVVSAPAVESVTGTAPRYYRVTWTVTGTTPSFTLGLYGK